MFDGEPPVQALLARDDSDAGAHGRRFGVYVVSVDGDAPGAGRPGAASSASSAALRAGEGPMTAVMVPGFAVNEMPDSVSCPSTDSPS
ncbi:hypothetical protein O974_08810 [Mycobacterium avium 11-0986]|nr:hypothetical protein O974_08810 [Mycobacterium avium 11-0986]